jgi:hypothetical protein
VLRITDPIDGAILNHNIGTVRDDGLEILVTGEAPAGAEVLVNGSKATWNGPHVSCRLLLREHRSTITATSGGETHSITVLWDQGSFKRYRYSTDDNCRFLSEIARDRPDSVFEHPYMALWRDMHEQYGTRVHHNLFFEHEDFDLTQMPDTYRDEWQANADWIRFSFHSRRSQPRNPYIDATAQQIVEDFDAVTTEVSRFAGSELLSPFTTVHWGEATLEACRALRERGILGLVGYFLFRDGRPRVAYYQGAEMTQYLNTHDYWYDTREDILFVKHDMVVNNVLPEDVVPGLAPLAADPNQTELFELMIHEPQFYPDYSGHRPRYREQVETSIRWATENGYKSVFYEEGFLGA